MTEEEIRPIAEKYVEEFCHSSNFEYTDADLICAGIGTALIVAKEKDKQIEDCDEKLQHYTKFLLIKYKQIEKLEAKIEKMKCCQNCNRYKKPYEIIKDCEKCINSSLWELKE